MKRTGISEKRRSIAIVTIAMVSCIVTGVLIGNISATSGKPMKDGTSVTRPRYDNDVRTDDTEWMLRLVNKWNPIEGNVDVTLTYLKNGHAVDERCYPDLQEMMDECRAAGLDPLICSSYRTFERQTELYNNKVNGLIQQGYSENEAKERAGRVVAIPGTSEHQIGLAVDIVDNSHQTLDREQEETEVQQWLIENSWRYGFILRYPSDKTDITGIIYEPWHYRYVGRAAAKDIHDAGICLEEYLAKSN